MWFIGFGIYGWGGMLRGYCFLRDICENNVLLDEL